jgi:5-methylcytosine-specific restriction endonuclease McrA
MTCPCGSSIPFRTSRGRPRQFCETCRPSKSAATGRVPRPKRPSAVECGTSWAYRDGCRCGQCKAADAVRSRAYYHERGGRAVHRARYEARVLGARAPRDATTALTRPCTCCGLMFTKPSFSQKRCDECVALHARKIELCAWCGEIFRTGLLSATCCSHHCVQMDRTRDCRRPGDDHRAKRLRREMAVPGLSIEDRNRLRAKWVRQRRTCYYCFDLATTVDHVIPLARGGDNFEGNLVPACRACNSSKHIRLIVEWKLAPRHQPRTKQCDVCQESYVTRVWNQRTCSDECRRMADAAREPGWIGNRPIMSKQQKEPWPEGWPTGPRRSLLLKTPIYTYECTACGALRVARKRGGVRTFCPEPGCQRVRLGANDRRWYRSIGDMQGQLRLID